MSRLARKKRCPATGKKRYPNKLDALTALATAQRKRGLGAQRVYLCRSCGEWHMTRMGMASGGRQS